MTTSASAGVAPSEDAPYTPTPTTELPSTVYIVGFAASWTETPWDDPDAHFWGLNALHKVAADKNWDAWFQLHDVDVAHPTDKDEHLDWLKAQPFPVWMWAEQIENHPLPNAVPYPRDYMTEKYGRYFTNTVSWMMALAIEQGYKKIGVYGVDMAQDCVSPDSRVLTSDLRWVEAGKIQVGDQLLAFDEEPGVERQSFRQWQTTEVLEANRIVRPSYRIHLDDGRSLVASAGHKWLTYGEHALRWKRTDELVTSAHRPERPTRLTQYLDVWDADDSRIGGYLAAAFDGEGHLSQNRTGGRRYPNMAVGFAQRENAMLEAVDSALAHHGFDISWGGDNVKKGTIRGGKAEVMRFLGTIRPARLLDQFDPISLGITQRRATPAVMELEYLGDQEVIGFTTTTSTIVVEGIASHNSEYGHQRPSCEYFIGVARGMGIEVEIPRTSDLLKNPFLYGFDDGGEFVAKMRARMKELQERRAEMERQRNAAHEAALQISGAMEDVQYWLRAWSAQEAMKNG